MTTNIKTNILDGRKQAGEVLAKLARELQSAFDRHHRKPLLAIILIGEDPASEIYVRNKIKAAVEVGIDTARVALASSISSKELVYEIDKLNRDDKVSGIIVQLPLPAHINKDSIFSAISPNKDVDGFNPVNVGYLHNGGNDKGFVPGTPLGILALIKHVELNLSGKNIVIVGRSNIVGKPVAALLLNEDCTVTICHSKTRNLADFTANADIVIAAMGKPKLLTSHFFSAKNIVIDVGINRDATSQKIVGDVDFDSVQPIVKYISPVPGGVGPMTIAFLLVNTFKAFMNNTQFIVTENE
jgi:methylenetetrahydrofolate dehydrogenase (NADP+) / methenyltetrahydrofolate cyclohydrolase